MKRAFVYKDEKSNKFWWINFEGNDFAVNYGMELMGNMKSKKIVRNNNKERGVVKWYRAVMEK